MPVILRAKPTEVRALLVLPLRAKRAVRIRLLRLPRGRRWRVEVWRRRCRRRLVPKVARVRVRGARLVLLLLRNHGRLLLLRRVDVRRQPVLRVLVLLLRLVLLLVLRLLVLLLLVLLLLLLLVLLLL
jgi:hypothetical protein